MFKRWSEANRTLKAESAERARLAEVELQQSSQNLRELRQKLKAKIREWKEREERGWSQIGKWNNTISCMDVKDRNDANNDGL